MKRIILAVWLCVAMAVLGAAPAAMAAPAVPDRVTDESGTLTAAQRDGLQHDLEGLQTDFRVVIVTTAFPNGKPADAEARFKDYAAKVLQDRQIPKDAVLITIAMQDRLIDFRVWTDSPVDQTLRDRTGQGFAAYTNIMLDGYRGPARSGDIPGGILSAARFLDGVLQAPPAAPAQPAVPQAEPAPAPAPVETAPLVIPQRTYEPPQPVTAPVPVPWQPRPAGSPWPWLGGAILLIAAGYWAYKFRSYRLKHRASLDLRDSFLGELLQLMEHQLPLARDYTGEETHDLYAKASAGCDQALAAEQQGEEQRQEAERIARFWRFATACRLLDDATGRYQEAQTASADARQAWETINGALREWDELSAGVGQRLTAAAGAISFAKSSKGWPLTALGARREQADATLALARSKRDQDPVQAARLAHETDAALAALTADLQALPDLARTLDEQKRHHTEAATQVDEARRTLSLRFVEASPDEALDRAAKLAARAEHAIPEGEADSARQALEGAAAAVAEATGIVEHYRKAIREYPQKSAALAGELNGLPADERQAAATLADLTARYAQDDWEDVHTLASDLADLQVDVRTGLDQAAELTGPAVQRYFQAEGLLDDLAARRERMRQALPVLTARPAELDALAAQARRDLQTMQMRIDHAMDEIARDNLILPADVADRLEDARRQYGAAEELGRAMPLPAHRWARMTADGAAVALGAREAVAEVARQAAAARAELARMQAEALSALAYERYASHHADSLRGAMSSAEMALTTGNYQVVLAETARAAECCHGLVSAYEDAHRSSSSGGGGGFDFGSSSSSGGGGSFDSGSSSSSSSGSSTGGGGSW